MLVRARTIVDEDMLIDAINGINVNSSNNQSPRFFLNSGSSALRLFLDLFGKGKRVGVQVFTCSTVIESIRSAGDNPVFLDINSEYYTTTIDILNNSISEIDILVLTHLFGIPNPDYVKIKEMCNEFGVVLIDDLCQTFHAKVEGQFLEDLSDNYFYSFFYDKPISSLSGGMLKVATKYEQQVIQNYELLPQESNRVGQKRLKVLYLMHKLLAPDIYSEEFRFGVLWKLLLGLWPMKWDVTILNKYLHSKGAYLMDKLLKLFIKKQGFCKMSDVERAYICSMMKKYQNNNQILMDFLESRKIGIPSYLRDKRITCSCAKRAILQKKMRSSQVQLALYNWPLLTCQERDGLKYPNAADVIKNSINIPCWTNLINGVEIEFEE